MTIVDVKVKKVDPKADIPSYQSAGSAGMDIHACLKKALVLESGERILVPTGLSFEIPEGFEGQIRSRSGLALKNGISVLNSPGTIDSDYRGELSVILINLSQNPEIIHNGDRIAQIVFAPVSRAFLEETETLSPTKRGEGGFGSTGV
ncbi:MAG: dUTP diphosphatase [Spirochaetaceae bacterium]|jgi:dUTP pyrophosphatase|nr:dUTP diphosphatase [Spirochaetaceae bacterium]